MNAFTRWSIFPTAIAAVIATTGLAMSQPVALSSNSPTVNLSGVSGGDKKDGGCAGFIAKTPNHSLQVTEDSNLRFTLQGAGQPTLLIVGSQGQTVCVQADSLAKGKIEIPGRWTKGNYSIFVGDRTTARSPYTLSIQPQN
jgi:hypothetical protein